jgi:hypothetical protein
VEEYKLAVKARSVFMIPNRSSNHYRLWFRCHSQHHSVCRRYSGEVDIVVADGQIVVKQGTLLTLDEVMAQARQHAGQLYQTAGIEIRPRWPVR